MLKYISKPWSTDIWSFGAVIIEIITGVPHWLSYKCRTVISGKNLVKTGLFSAKG